MFSAHYDGNSSFALLSEKSRTKATLDFHARGHVSQWVVESPGLEEPDADPLPEPWGGDHDAQPSAGLLGAW